MADLPIPLVPFRTLDEGETLFEQAATSYPSAPPSLYDLRIEDETQARVLFQTIGRREARCPAETVVLYRDAYVMDGSYIVTAELRGVAESYYNVPRGEALAARQIAQLDRIAAADVADLPADGPPVVLVFAQDCNNFGHVLAEMLPRLLHVRAAGMRAIRLLLPDAAAAFMPMIEFAVRAMELDVTFVPCAPGTVLRVRALHWVSLVGEGYYKSPTVLRLFARLRAAAGRAMGHERVYVARPEVGRRVVRNAAAVAEVVEAAGYVSVEPSRLDFAEQIALFAGARRVVGPMGAAMTLMAAMDRGGQVATFSPPYCDYFYWDLACLSGHGFAWAFTGPITAFRGALLDQAMTIDTGLLGRVLAHLAETG